MDKIAVLIPCYNESKTVEKVVSDFRRVLPDATVYVYDNNSTDGTAELAAGAGAVVRHEYQQGKGNVMRRMFREIDAEAYILVDGDDTYPAEAAPEMVAAVTGRQADMVVGDRLSSTYYTQNKRPFHNFGNDLVRFFTNHLFGGKIKDIMTGYRAFSYQFVKTYPVLSRGFEIETEMTIHALQRNMQVENVVIDYRDRPEGSESKLNTYSDGFKVLGTIARLFKNYRPFSFFGIVDLLSILPPLTMLSSGFKLFRLFRLNKALKALKFLRYSHSFELILNVIKREKRALAAVCVLAGGYIALSALIMFQVEPDSFDTFFDAIYWAVVTLTTVGYGDIYPTSEIGRIVSMTSSFMGIAIVALPTGIITAGYMRELSREKWE